MDKRIPVSIAVLLVAVGVLIALNAGGSDGESGSFQIQIDGPDGTVWNGTVDVANGTAFSVLMAAAGAGDFAVEYSGTGDMVFVESIAGYRYQGSGGWCYAVWTDGQWAHPVVSAAAWGLADGDAVWWHYETDGCPAG